MQKDKSDKLEQETDAPLEHNTKIMVNWDKRLITSTGAPVGSPKYNKLVELGYDEVGEYKPRRNSFFWLQQFFSIGHKYLK